MVLNGILETPAAHVIWYVFRKFGGLEKVSIKAFLFTWTKIKIF